MTNPSISSPGLSRDLVILMVLSSLPSHGKPVILHDAASTGSAAYMNLAKEFMQRNRKQ